MRLRRSTISTSLQVSTCMSKSKSTQVEAQNERIKSELSTFYQMFKMINTDRKFETEIYIKGWLPVLGCTWSKLGRGLKLWISRWILLHRVYQWRKVILRNFRSRKYNRRIWNLKNKQFLSCNWSWNCLWQKYEKQWVWLMKGIKDFQIYGLGWTRLFLVTRENKSKRRFLRSSLTFSSNFKFLILSRFL